MVAPLVVEGAFKPAARLNPLFELKGETLVLSTAELAGVPKTALGPVVSSLASERDAIIAALDLMFTGI